MAKALITLTWCDRHLTEKDEEVPAEPMPEWADGWGVDLCAECATPVHEVMALYQRYGAKGKRTPQMTTRPAPKRPDRQTEGPFTCPQEGCGAVLATRGSLGAHGRQIHGVSLGELLGQPLNHKCPEKGCGKAFSTGHGLAVHMRSHGVTAAKAGAGA
jgi:C2H2 type zinc finger protein